MKCVLKLVSLQVLLSCTTLEKKFVTLGFTTESGKILPDSRQK